MINHLHFVANQIKKGKTTRNLKRKRQTTKNHKKIAWIRALIHHVRRREIKNLRNIHKKNSKKKIQKSVKTKTKVM